MCWIVVSSFTMIGMMVWIQQSKAKQSDDEMQRKVRDKEECSIERECGNAIYEFRATDTTLYSEARFISQVTRKSETHSLPSAYYFCRPTIHNAI
jgi:hypothetical protein